LLAAGRGMTGMRAVSSAVSSTVFFAASAFFGSGTTFAGGFFSAGGSGSFSFCVYILPYFSIRFS